MLGGIDSHGETQQQTERSRPSHCARPQGPGRQAVRGTRVAVDLLLEKLAQGVSHDAILDDFPFLEPDDVRAALWYAVHVLRDEIEYLEQSA